VAGPADGPPVNDADANWLSDWTTRARRTLARAQEWATSPEKILKERAMAIANRIRGGASAIARTSRYAAEKVRGVLVAANAVTLGLSVASIVLTGILAYVAWKILK
jgi:hypothetical protein